MIKKFFTRKKLVVYIVSSLKTGEIYGVFDTLQAAQLYMTDYPIFISKSDEDESKEERYKLKVYGVQSE